MQNANKLPVPEHVQQTVEMVIEECELSGLAAKEVFSSEHLTHVAQYAMERTGADLTVPKMRRATRRFVWVAFANSAIDRHLN